MRSERSVAPYLLCLGDLTAPFELHCPIGAAKGSLLRSAAAWSVRCSTNWERHSSRRVLRRAGTTAAPRRAGRGWVGRVRGGGSCGQWPRSCPARPPPPRSVHRRSECVCRVLADLGDDVLKVGQGLQCDQRLSAAARRRGWFCRGSIQARCSAQDVGPVGQDRGKLLGIKPIPGTAGRRGPLECLCTRRQSHGHA